MQQQHLHDEARLQAHRCEQGSTISVHECTCTAIRLVCAWKQQDLFVSGDMRILCRASATGVE